MVLGTQLDTDVKIKSTWRIKISIDQAWYAHIQQKTENSLSVFYFSFFPILSFSASSFIFTVYLPVLKS